MKHIKKSFLLQMDSSKFDKKLHECIAVGNATEDVLKKNNGALVYCTTTKNKTIGGLVQKINGKHYFFPVPDPTLVYFHSAQTNLISAKELKSTLIKVLSYEEMIQDIPIHELYDYYGRATAVIINLFTALESFLNQQIPSTYEYRKKANKCTEVYTHREIMENLDFKTKLIFVIPAITGKNFMQKQTPTNGYIWTLKEFRDDIIHTKPKGEHPLYEDLMKKSLNFKYDNAIEAVAKLMNFYQPNYVIECGCGKDF